ncbi:MAG: electron transfer flavoprotein subunit beta/FixA family protein [Coriobacteriia bacterium]|nr:electron transfer flavoprotein subunit beta/FixA family protein [Coriobacteriia bacterium]
MEKIIVCYKWVVDENDISVDYDGNIKMREPSYKVSLYDRNAIEAGTQLAEKCGAQCVALTAGDAKSEKSRKEALCAGPSEGFAVIDDALESADSLLTATILSAAISKIGDAQLVICGEGSGDVYAQQVGPRIAAALGWPLLTYATSIEVDGEKLRIKRDGSEGTELLEAVLPLVVTVAGDCNTPRMPGLKDVMGAGKKPFTIWSPSELNCSAEELVNGLATMEIIGNRPDRKNIVIKGSGKEAADEVIRGLISEGVLG